MLVRPKLQALSGINAHILNSIASINDRPSNLREIDKGDVSMWSLEL
jgi:hypothetical protein